MDACGLEGRTQTHFINALHALLKTLLKANKYKIQNIYKNTLHVYTREGVK